MIIKHSWGLMDGNEIISLPSKDFSPDLSLCAYNRFYENILH